MRQLVLISRQKEIIKARVAVETSTAEAQTEASSYSSRSSGAQCDGPKKDDAQVNAIVLALDAQSQTAWECREC